MPVFNTGRVDVAKFKHCFKHLLPLKNTDNPRRWWDCLLALQRTIWSKRYLINLFPPTKIIHRSLADFIDGFMTNKFGVLSVQTEYPTHQPKKLSLMGCTQRMSKRLMISKQVMKYIHHSKKLYYCSNITIRKDEQHE